jgi:hypothetical protein
MIRRSLGNKCSVLLVTAGNTSDIRQILAGHAYVFIHLANPRCAEIYLVMQSHVSIDQSREPYHPVTGKASNFKSKIPSDDRS